MSLVIAFHRAASAEFIAASAWYENKRQGLALAFMAEIDRCVSQAAEQPLQYAIAHQDIRRAVVRNFPYSVYFRLEPQRIVVLAVFHSRRNPDVWLGRVK